MKRAQPEYIVIEDDDEDLGEKNRQAKRHKPSEEEEEEDIIDLNNVPTTEIFPRPQSIRQRDDWITYMRYNHYVSYSTVPSAGRGAYTRVDIPAGAYLGRYEGRVLTQEEAATSTSAYMLHRRNIDRGRWEVVDASDPKCSSWLRYINDANDQAGNNTRITQTGHFVALRPIPAHSELFASYGSHYWKK